MESPYVTSYYSLIVILAVSDTEYRKLLILPTAPLFDARALGEPLRISG